MNNYYFQLVLVCIALCEFGIPHIASKSSAEPQTFEHVRCKILRNRVTLSGASSGSNFAQILHLSHSEMFSGSGHFAGFFYKCGGQSKNFREHYVKCGIPQGWTFKDPFDGKTPDPHLSDVSTAIDTLKDYERKGLIDPRSELYDHIIYNWMGLLDQWVSNRISRGIAEIFRRHIKDPRNIHTVIQNSTHHIPTLTSGGNCTSKDDRILGACRYDGPKEMLQFLLSRKTYKVWTPTGLEKLQELLEFDQTSYFDGIKGTIGLDKTGYIYIPSGCQKTSDKCHLHIFFHACFASKSTVGKRIMTDSGFLEIAEKNSIIVIFPQAMETPENPEGCWDMYGYTGSKFGHKGGTQIRIMRRMIDRILEFSI